MCFKRTSIMEKSDTIPISNNEYKDREYWDARYAVENRKEWLVDYVSLKNIIDERVTRTDRILMLGCGNSSFSEEMYMDGYERIVNIDYSPVVITKMAESSPSALHMKWHVMDAAELTFPDGSFDVVIEKATIDAMMVEEKNPWSISTATRVYVQKVLKEVSRVLVNKGKFISVTFSQPHFRGPLYADPVYGWSYSCQEIGCDFHHFVYVMVKGEPLRELPFIYKPPLFQGRPQPVEDEEKEDFILEIGL